MMQDGRALQVGTSHNLGQNFAKAFDITYTDQSNQVQHAWTTSWGVSTRLIGTLIMAHADDDGMIVPPRVAPTHVVILPITPKEETRNAVMNAAQKLKNRLRGVGTFHHARLEVEIDARDIG